MKYLTAITGLILSLVSFSAHADTYDVDVQLHFASQHFTRFNEYGERWNQTNPGAGIIITSERYAYFAGGYKNSYFRTTAYLGAAYIEPRTKLRLGVMLVTGYINEDNQGLKDLPVPCPVVQANIKGLVLTLLPMAVGFGVEF